MVIIMNPEATAENISDVIQAIEGAGLQAKLWKVRNKKL